MAHRAGLAGEPAAGDRDDDVVLAVAVGDAAAAAAGSCAAPGGRNTRSSSRLVDRDLAGAGLDPDAGDRVLALAGRVGAALGVELLDVLGSLGSGGLDARP